MSILKSMFIIDMSNTIHFETCFCSNRLGNKNTENKGKIQPVSSPAGMQMTSTSPV